MYLTTIHLTPLYQHHRPGRRTTRTRFLDRTHTPFRDRTRTLFRDRTRFLVRTQDRKFLGQSLGPDEIYVNTVEAFGLASASSCCLAC